MQKIQELIDQISKEDQGLAELQQKLESRRAAKVDLLKNLSSLQIGGVLEEVDKLIKVWGKLEVELEVLKDKVREISKSNRDWAQIDMGRHPIYTTICDSFLKEEGLNNLHHGDFIQQIATMCAHFQERGNPAPFNIERD